MKTFSRRPSEKKRNKVVCNLCGSDDTELLWQFDNWSFSKCRECGLVYQNPQPDSDELAGRYDGEYLNYELKNEESFFRLMSMGLADIGFDTVEKSVFSRTGRTGGENPLFVDVGCATGLLLESMKKRGWNAFGAELCRESAEYGTLNRGVEIFPGTLEEACLDDSSVSVLHSSHLVEHLTDPDSFFREASRIIRPGGYMVTVTPDISGFQAVLFGADWRSAIADHMYLFSKKTLGQMLIKNGFCIKKTVSWGGLAVGTAPLPIKKAADKMVKLFGWGDVVCILSMIPD